jgi:hypothetical protein
LESTVDDSGSYGTSMDKEEVRSMKVAKGNIFYAKLLKGAKHIPKGYSRTERWNRPLAKALGGRSFEADVNVFLKMIIKDPDLELTKNKIEEKVLEVSQLAGMLAFSNKGERAWMFYMETAVSHPLDLFAESWGDNNRMKDSNATRVFWTVGALTGHQWASQNIYFPPVAAVKSSKTKPKLALKPDI